MTKVPQTWEEICETPGCRVRRIAVPGGHLYQTQVGAMPTGASWKIVWERAVFVPTGVQ